MALWRRGRPRDLLHHSLMTEQVVMCSLSRSGNVWDNAAMESFFSSLKTERTTRKGYRRRDSARADVFGYIERFYNLRRRHSTLGYNSPVDFEAKIEISSSQCPRNRGQLTTANLAVGR